MLTQQLHSGWRHGRTELLRLRHVVNGNYLWTAQAARCHTRRQSARRGRIQRRADKRQARSRCRYVFFGESLVKATRLMYHRVYMRSWNKTPKGRAASRRYRASVKGRTYNMSPKRRAYLKAWNRSPKRRAYAQVYYKSPKWRAYLRARARAYYKTPKGRAYLREGFHKRRAHAVDFWTTEQFVTLCRKYRNLCACCGRRRKLTPDHVRPLSKGGRNVIKNIQPLCLSCNTSKGAKTGAYTCVCKRYHKCALKRMTA